MKLIRKRKLSDHQNRRIKTQQQSNIELSSQSLARGLVVTHYGRQFEVKLTELPEVATVQPDPIAGEPESFWLEPAIGEIWRCHARTNLEPVATGDEIRLSLDPNTGQGTIEAILPRRSAVMRPDRYHNLKPVAVNLDLMLIVYAPLPVPSSELIDRYLVIARVSELTPVLVLNKSDLIEEDQQARGWLDDYESLGFQTLITSASGDLSELEALIKGQTVVFLGQSGVGKSSLINTLEPLAAQRINQISDNSDLGQHTTTTSRLIDFNQGALIDSPGVREYGVWHLKPEQIDLGFPEISEIAQHCRFRNCSHAKEPGCAVKAAVTAGEILERRLLSYEKLRAEAVAF